MSLRASPPGPGKWTPITSSPLWWAVTVPPVLLKPVSSVQHCVVDSSGDLYLSTYYAVRKVTTATGIIQAFAGSLTYSNFAPSDTLTSVCLEGGPGALFIDSVGEIYINNNFILRNVLGTNALQAVVGIPNGALSFMYL